MQDNLQLKPILLRMLIGTLVLSALIGIYTFLFGHFGETEAKLLLTTLTISYFSVILLACAAAFEKRTVALLYYPGIAAGVAGMLVYLPGIWGELFDTEPYVKTVLILGILSFTFAQASLLSLAQLDARYQVFLHGTYSAVLALALLATVMIMFEWDNEWLFRVMGVLGILDGCGTVSIPVLSKLSTTPVIETAFAGIRNIELSCPRCGHRGRYPLGTIHCPRCSLILQVEIVPKS